MGIILAEENDASEPKKIENEVIEKRKKKLRKKKNMITPKTFTVKGMKIPILTKDNESFNVESFLENQDPDNESSIDTDNVKNYVKITAESLLALTPEKKAALDEENHEFHRLNAGLFSARFRNSECRTESMRIFDNLTFLTTVHHMESCLEIEKIYHNNLNIKSKYLIIPGNVPWNGTRVGVGYVFDENGEFLKEVNCNGDYKFTYLDVIKYCEDNKIELYTPKRRAGARIEKITEGEKVAWLIRYRHDAEKGIYIIHKILDGESGELIRMEKKEWGGR